MANGSPLLAQMASGSLGFSPAAIKAAKNRIRGHEGYRAKVYSDGKVNKDKISTNATIGFGHLLMKVDKITGKPLKGQRNKGINSLVNAGFSRNRARVLVDKLDGLTRNEAEWLFDSDVNIAASNALERLPNSPTYRPETQVGIINGFYRGDLAQSKKTLGMIDNGDFLGASGEFLRNDEYANAVKNKQAGIRPRMEEIARGFFSESATNQGITY